MNIIYFPIYKFTFMSLNICFIKGRNFIIWNDDFIIYKISNQFIKPEALIPYCNGPDTTQRQKWRQVPIFYRFLRSLANIIKALQKALRRACHGRGSQLVSARSKK